MITAKITLYKNSCISQPIYQLTIIFDPSNNDLRLTWTGDVNKIKNQIIKCD